MLSRLQRTKGYFFAVCILLSAVVCFFSWQMLRQTPYQALKEVAKLGMTDQISKIVPTVENMWHIPAKVTKHQRTNEIGINKDLKSYFKRPMNITSKIQRQNNSTRILGRRYLDKVGPAVNDVRVDKENFLRVKSRFPAASQPFKHIGAIPLFERVERDRLPLELQQHINNTFRRNQSIVEWKPKDSYLHPLIRKDTTIKEIKNKSLPKHDWQRRKVALQASVYGFSVNQKVVNSNVLSTMYVDDIHNFHVPFRKYSSHKMSNESKKHLIDHYSTGKLCENCLKAGFQYILNVEKLCTGDVDLLIMVESPPNNVLARDAIRSTWGEICKWRVRNVRCIFLIGKSLEDSPNLQVKTEHWQHSDIVQMNFLDAYTNLTYKTLSGLHWATTFCSNAKYIMKTDDDMYVNGRLIEKMLQAAPKTQFIAGNCWGVSKPHRDSNSKWYVPFEMYPATTFPPMCSGTGYIISRDLVHIILNVSVSIPFFYLEDVYIALCVEKIGVRPVNIQGFNNMLVTFDNCNFRNYVFTSHGHMPSELIQFWPLIRECPKKDIPPHQLYIPVSYPDVD